MKFTSSHRLAALATGAAVALQMSPAFAAFSDVSGSPYKSAIDALEERGVLEGYTDGTFKPEATINRAEFLKIILEARGGESFDGANCFPDVRDEWFAKYVCAAKDEAIVGGYPDGSFKPEQPVTFVEAGKILTLAFKQQTQGGSEWYEPYARALEASKAIPTSVNALDENLTRGEMAEMMWRLRDGITDRPSKGYLNVKYPEMDVNTASDDVQIATSCADLRAFAEEAQKGGMNMYYGVEDAAEGAPVPSASPRAENKATAADGDYSQTNVQVAGVDEGDVVKTDGEYIYAVSNGTVRIVKAVPATDLRETAVIDFEDENFTANDLYVDGDRLIVLGTGWENRGGGVYPMMEKMSADRMMIWPGPWGWSKTEARIYDIATKSSPRLVREVTFDGNVVSSRRIEDKLYLVMNQMPQYWGGPIPLTRTVSEDDLLPSYSDSANNVVDQPVTDCAKVSILPHVPSPQYLMIGVVPLRDTKQKVNTEVILGSAENVYASLENLYVATTEWNYVWDSQNPRSNQKTNVFRFSYEPDGVEMRAQGQVPGRILNQFSMDEHENHFRIATTLDQQWRANDETIPSENQLYTLNMNMDRTGAIEDLAPGETIYSVRFMGDRAYVVTFKQVDPLFVIDLSDPRDPEVLGKLKIPGYSNYLHPYDGNHVIGIGKEVDENINKEKTRGDTVHYTAILGLKLSLFDVSDVNNPKELHKIVIGDRGTESPVLYDHRALLFEKDRDLLAFPISVVELPEGAKPQDEFAYGSQTFQGAYAFKLTVEDGFDELGRVTQYTEEEMQKSGQYLYGKNVERVLRVGETLYTLSQAGVQSNKLDGLAKQDTVWFSNNPVRDVVYPEESR